MLAWTIFLEPLRLPAGSVLWLVIPLCASVAVVYKTVRTGDLGRLPREIVLLLLYMLAGLFALGAGLWLILKYWPR